jgi:hypothetical protein
MQLTFRPDLALAIEVWHVAHAPLICRQCGPVVDFWDHGT